MEFSQWFDYQLQSTLDGFIWAIGQVPKERLHLSPPTPLGEWSAAQHVFHMLDYEKRLALPTMYQWLGDQPSILEATRNAIEQKPPPIEEMLAEFEKARKSEIHLLARFNHATWNLVQRTTVWGEVSLYWLVCKTYQHTAEHTHNILRLVLFWDRITNRTAQGQ